MKKISAMKALFVSSVLAVQVAQAERNIVGGEPVSSLSEAPYMVSLSGSCGGSIISPKWVLTAAHCAGYFSEVKGGVLNLVEKGHSYRVKRTIKHPKYNSWTMTHDYALVELQDAINFEETKLAPVKLATPEFAEAGGQEAGIDATVYGFGNIGERMPNDPEVLNKVIVPIVSNEVANAEEAYNGGIDQSMIAAGYAKGGKDSCQGDSGGPLVVFDQNNEPVQIGVVSWGEGCARAEKYGIYSRVSEAHAWIKETTRSIK